MSGETRTDGYVLPWTASEGERLDLQHQILVKLIGGLFMTPLKKDKVRRILDLGCGTGIWASDCAREYPNAEIVGLDLNNWPSWKSAPSNCTFKVGDIESDATWNDLGEPFDAIHWRFLMAGIKNWPAVVDRCSAHLAPGGWIESQEVGGLYVSHNGATAKDSKMLEWHELCKEGLKKAGLTLRAADSFPAILSKAGLKHIRVEDCFMKFGMWPEDAPDRDIIEMGTKNIMSGLRGFGETLFISHLGWTAQQHEELCDAAIKDATTKQQNLSLPIKICIAQK